MDKPLILLTNDDGIHSAGLWAAAVALESLGEVLVVAPEEKQSGAGRSMPLVSRGRIQQVGVKAGGKVWDAYAVHGAPAQVVQHALLELAPRRVDLVVSGINYGENVGVSITISGTVGAALEGAAFGIPGLAVSQQATLAEIKSQDPALDFSGAAYFTRQFARAMLAARLPGDVDVLKVEVPRGATPQTPWQVTHLSRERYYLPLKPRRERLEDEARIGFKVDENTELEAGSDGWALGQGYVAVTPLSLDMTSRVEGESLRALLNGKQG